MTADTLIRERAVSSEPDLAAVMAELGRGARGAAASLALADLQSKSAALLDAARAVRTRSSDILNANARDLAEAERQGISAALRDRLALDPKRLEAIAAGLEAIAALPEPTGRVLEKWSRPNGLDIERVSVPLGVIGIIYESRPNVTAEGVSR
jgi:glutamate-5-semialdehyde dehydrogenase